MTLIWGLPSECHFLMFWSLYKIMEINSADLKFDKLYHSLATYWHNIWSFEPKKKRCLFGGLKSYKIYILTCLWVHWSSSQKENFQIWLFNTAGLRSLLIFCILAHRHKHAIWFLGSMLTTGSLVIVGILTTYSILILRHQWQNHVLKMLWGICRSGFQFLPETCEILLLKQTFWRKEVTYCIDRRSWQY